MQPPANVGVVGLGAIGRGVAAALLRGGYQVVGHDVRGESAATAGVRVAATPVEVAEVAELVLVAVYDDAQVRDVLAGADGLLGAGTPPRAVAILSTVTLPTVRWAVERAAAVKVAVLDCGVSGGSMLCTEGRIVAMVGGDDEVVAWARPALETFGVPTVHTGPVGTGMAAKIARNTITYGGWFVALEAARLAAAGGVAVETLVEICAAADGSSGGPTGILQRGIRAGTPRDDADRQAREALAGYVRKDLGATIALAAELGVDAAGASLVSRAFPDLVGVDDPEA